jgi:hypothetical protein
MMALRSSTARPMEVAQVGRRTGATAAVRMPVSLAAKPKLATGCVGFRVESSALACAGAALSNGSKVFMMRHKCKVARLGRPADQRKVRVTAATIELANQGRASGCGPQRRLAQCRCSTTTRSTAQWGSAIASPRLGEGPRARAHISMAAAACGSTLHPKSLSGVYGHRQSHVGNVINTSWAIGGRAGLVTPGGLPRTSTQSSSIFSTPLGHAGGPEPWECRAHHGVDACRR